MAALLAFLGLKNLQDIAFEVERMVGREGGRMVARLHEKLQKARVAPGIMRRFAEHGEKQLGRHELAAGARDKKAAGLDQLHAAQVQLLIAAVGVIERFAAFGEGGRVADDEAELLLLVGPRFGKVEDVFTDGGDFVFHAVERGVAAERGKAPCSETSTEVTCDAP